MISRSLELGYLNGSITYSLADILSSISPGLGIGSPASLEWQRALKSTRVMQRSAALLAMDSNVPFEELVANLRGLEACNYSSSKSHSIFRGRPASCDTDILLPVVIVGALTFTVHDMVSSIEGEVWRLTFCTFRMSNSWQHPGNR